MNKKLTKGLVAGALIGGAVTGFAMSKQGRALGKKIASSAEELYRELQKKAGDLAEMSKDTYEELVERISEEYAEKKELAHDAKEKLIKQLKAKWNDYQVDTLYRELKKSYKRLEDKSKTSYTELVEEVVKEYGKNKKLTSAVKEKIVRDLKSRWSEIKETMAK
jgi:ribosomal protein L16 Arg81 hydroxylase